MNIEDMVKLIIEKTGKDRNEIHALILEKRKKLKMIITEEAAAKLVAKDLKVDMPVESMEREDELASFKINDLLKLKPGNDSVNVTGVIQRMYLPHVFISKKTGSQSKVLNLILNDGTGTINAVIWGDHVDRFEKENVGRGDCIKIIRGMVRQGRFISCSSGRSSF